jgi:hypothetical protein
VARAAQDRADRTRLGDREYDDRQRRLAGKRECCRIHDLVAALDRLRMRQAVESLGLRALFGIGIVDAVDIGGLQHRLRADFGRAQHRGRICREERIAGSTAEQDDASLGEIFVRRSAGEQLGNLRHHERRQRPRRRALALDGGLQREAVHHGGEHAHGVAGRARDAAGRYFHAADDVAAADHDRDLGAELACRDQIVGDAVEGGLVDAERLAACEILARELDHDATIDRLSHANRFLVPAQASGAARAGRYFPRLFLAAGGSNLGCEIGFLLPSPPGRPICRCRG